MRRSTPRGTSAARSRAHHPPLHVQRPGRPPRSRPSSQANAGPKEQSMLKAKLAFIVGNCTRLAWSVVALAGLLALVSGIYAARHFAIDTDINRLISPDLPWRQQELAFDPAFPQRNRTIFAVIAAPAPEVPTAAGTALPGSLRGQKARFQSVAEPQNSPLFVRDGL